MSKTRTADASANNEFIGRCLRFDALMAQLQAMRADHFGADAETARNWGEVGSVGKINDLLAEAVEFLGGQPA